jgi:hypothetical protein
MFPDVPGGNRDFAMLILPRSGSGFELRSNGGPASPGCPLRAADLHAMAVSYRLSALEEWRLRRMYSGSRRMSRWFRVGLGGRGAVCWLAGLSLGLAQESGHRL